MPDPAPRRFCLVTTFYPPYSFGGDAIQVQNLAVELARRGHRVDVVHSLDAYRALARGRPLPAAAPAPPNLTVHALCSRFGWLELFLMHQLGRPVLHARELARRLSRPYDVIHFHNVSLIGGPKVLEYGRGVKLYTTHEAWLVCPTHTLFRFNRAPCERPFCTLCAIAYGRPPQWWRHTRLLSKSSRHIDAFLSPSRSNTEAHRARGADLPFVDLPNFVPEQASDDPTAASDVDREADRPFFLYAGRLERLKGAQTLLPVFRRFREAQLVVAGRGSEEERMRREAAGTDVRFEGQLERAALERLYRSAVAVIIPSLCQESFGLVALEAFRARTPIVARHRGALPEIVAASGGGLLYRDDEELVAALGRLCADRAYRDELGERGYRSFRALWSADVHVPRYLELVERLLAEKMPRATAARGTGRE